MSAWDLLCWFLFSRFRSRLEAGNVMIKATLECVFKALPLQCPVTVPLSSFVIRIKNFFFRNQVILPLFFGSRVIFRLLMAKF